MRRAVFAVAAAEFAVLGGWVYFAHGAHLYQLGDQALGSLRGEQIVYAEVCGRDGKDRVMRVVVNRAAPGKSLADAT